MSTLQVHITAGPQAGARLQLNQSPVSFGRSAENTLVLDLAVVSRQHGELVLDAAAGQWLLINHSANTTRVGRKKAGKKPVPLTDGASINIGDTEVFRVYLAPPAEEPAATAPSTGHAEQPTGPAAGTGMKGRSKLWIGIGVWIGLLIFGAAALKLGLDDGEDDNLSAGPGFYIPGREIEGMDGPEAGRTAIKRLLDDELDPQDPNATLYDTHLADARRATDGGSRSLYDAYTHYQKAISYAADRNNPLDSLDTIKYDNVLTELSVVIHDGYINAYRLYNEGDYQAARDQLDAIRRDYYAGDHRVNDPLAAHIKKLRNAAHGRAR